MAQDEAGGGPQTIKVRRSRSLMAKLVVTFLVLSILMVGVVALLATQRARASLEESVYGRLEAAQVLTSQSVVRWIEEQRRNLTFTASLLGGVQQQNSPGAPTDVVAELLDSESAAEVKVVAREELRARLQSIVRQTADAAEIFVLDENGVIVASTTPAHEGLDQSDEEYVTRGVSGQYTRPVGRSDLSDDPAVIVSTPLFDSDGLLRGVLAANLDLSRLDRIVLQETGLGDGGQSYLVDSESEFVHARLSESTDDAVQIDGHRRRACADDGARPVPGLCGCARHRGVRLAG